MFKLRVKHFYNFLKFEQPAPRSESEFYGYFVDGWKCKKVVYCLKKH